MKKCCCLQSALLIVFLTFGMGTSWGKENQLDLLSGEEKATYYKRLAELQKVGEELFHIIVNEDVDRLANFLHGSIRVAVGADYYLDKNELLARLKDKNSFEYCRLFNSKCYQEKVRGYRKEAREWKSIKDYLINVKNLKINAEIKKRFRGGYYLSWGYISFNWEGKKPFWEKETFVSPSFIYRDGKWWLSNMFSEN